MFYLRRPSDDTIHRVLDRQKRLPFSYPEVGATRIQAPGGYPLNHHRGRIGEGADAYSRAVAAMRRWAMYDLPWTTLCWPDAPIREGVMVAVLVRHYGFWGVHPCRIVYTLAEAGPVKRFGFAFGTLPGHAERGEERFTVEYHTADDSVWYEIYTFAEARHPLVRLAKPLLRRTQLRFGRESVEAMRRAVALPRSGREPAQHRQEGER